jgi:putative SOS response-associated peptidase YedK
VGYTVVVAHHSAGVTPRDRDASLRAVADSNEAIRPLHDRMPVLLHSHEYEQWLRGSFEDLLAFQKRCFSDDLIEIQPTNELWVQKKALASSEAPSLL